MGRQKGYSKLSCDRCQSSTFVSDGSTDSQSWHDISHLNSMAAAGGHAPSTLTLCDDCYKSFQRYATNGDALFDKWLRSGKGQES
ncbi:hypothetical protein [Bifidobacterium moukalabense]|jgi:hypothetical protein|uniref:Uncharacterized protein n=1 Tax=Bifidobacterium moukalabense DSM 27321 TaxID=1435051 RepID=W4NAV7_9BIFI|nr:hypothetical protein [Bifidobacterium moukalabense]ETY72207.1 hypothetical protein BMOU_0221 [Bifidobacterium moukalabense DSM 27321]